MKDIALVIASIGSSLVPLPAVAGDLLAKLWSGNYVRTCSWAGDGFYYIPGAETCLRISGYARVDYGLNATSVQVPQTVGGAGAQDRTLDPFQTRHRFQFQFDARTSTQLGTLRTVGRFYVSNQSQSETYSATRAYIQWAGLTIGRAQSSAYYLRLRRKLAAHYPATKSAAFR